MVFLISVYIIYYIYIICLYVLAYLQFLLFLDKEQILKYCIVIIMVVLLTHECVVETLDSPETSVDLQVVDSLFILQEHNNKPQFLSFLFKNLLFHNLYF